MGPPPLTRIVKILLFINGAAFVTLLLLGRTSGFDQVLRGVCLIPERVVHHLALWQLVTTFFVHIEFWHLAFNMLGLYIFGPTLEGKLGAREFLRLYMVSGLAGSICTVGLAYILAAVAPATYAGLPHAMVLGASGALFGLLTTYASCFPDTVFLVMFIVPMKARNMAILFISIDAFMLVTGHDAGIAYTAHLGGALGGWLYYRMTAGKPRSPKPQRKKQVEAKVIEGRFKDIMRDVDD